ncbi:hypothetical protein FRC04_012107 [Tulasnella sp. 424]|nr:hypothetical protein FRC04_012107 [Tulasnella sp. 424]KAG8971082.1 hypothetical protein FRC05_011548 [Tulasnella sp. 425]
MGVAVPQAFGKFQKEIRKIIGAGKGPKTTVPAAPNESLAPQVDSESEDCLEYEDPSRLGMAGKAAVSVLGLPFVTVGAALGAAGSILGGVATAVDNIGKAAGPSSSRPTRKKSQRQ